MPLWERMIQLRFKMKLFRKWRFRFERRPSVSVSATAGKTCTGQAKSHLLIHSANTQSDSVDSGDDRLGLARSISVGELVSAFNDCRLRDAPGRQHCITKYYLGLPMAGNFLSSDFFVYSRPTT